MDVTVFSKFPQGEGEESRVPSFNTMEMGEEYEDRGWFVVKIWIFYGVSPRLNMKG